MKTSQKTKKCVKKHIPINSLVDGLRNSDYTKICRACLGQEKHLREIYSTNIPEMMQTCASIKVSENDGLPDHVCDTCFELIGQFYNFKKKMEKSDMFLRMYLNQPHTEQSDIITIAFKDAEIKDCTKSPSVTSGENISQAASCLREEDVPLSDKLCRLVKESNTGDNKGDEDLSQLVIEEHETFEADAIICNNSDFSSQIFTDGPPPLVPLAPQSITETAIENVNDNKNISVDTPPPLIPIKPILNLDSIIDNIELKPDIKLNCSVCNDKFVSLNELKQHKIKKCQANVLQCNVCQREFKERKKLIGHLKGHMVVKEYCCKLCNKCYPNPSTFRVHMRSHTGERPFKCHICGKGFIRWAGVVGHLKTHEDVKPFKCDICGKCFKMASNLERHKILHTGVLPYCCNYCGKTFSQSDNLQLHIRTYHTNERPYLCNECGKGFVSSTRLKRHMWVHSGYKPYACQMCPKAYSNSNDLKNHYKIHVKGDRKDDDKHYACTQCGLKFYHPCRLARHMKTHDKPYSCHVCNKKFHSNNILAKHMEKLHKIMYVNSNTLHSEDALNIYVEYQQ